jgi:hypothetical protein
MSGEAQWFTTQRRPATSLSLQELSCGLYGTRKACPILSPGGLAGTASQKVADGRPLQDEESKHQA